MLMNEQQMRVVTANPSTLKEAVEIAHNIDSILWSVKQSIKYRQYKDNTNSSRAPMELDTIKHSTTDAHKSRYNKISDIDPKKIDRRKSKGLCLRCGKSGHRIVTCRNFQYAHQPWSI